MKFTWCGKENAIIESMTPSTGTLRPDKESSKNWDNTENLYIEGDNLEVLKLLQKSYFGKVKMIYIDPPYNTGKDFVYKDNFIDNITNYKKITKQTTKANPETNGRYHTDWLNMMYPRIKLARNLLKEDKIISENKDKEGIENLDIGFKVFKLEYNCGGENHSIMKDGIKVDIIKRPKDKPICKFKVYGELYYLVKTDEDIIVFPYKSGIKGKVIASIFNIESCKDREYMQLEYLYNMKLNEFNGEDFIHSQYVTSVILDNVYKHLID